jgi:hypothetical protein
LQIFDNRYFTPNVDGEEEGEGEGEDDTDGLMHLVSDRSLAQIAIYLKKLQESNQSSLSKRAVCIAESIIETAEWRRR